MSIVRPVRRSLLESVFADRVGRRFAAAAAVLLLAGGATWTVTSVLSRPAPMVDSPVSVASAEDVKSAFRGVVDMSDVPSAPPPAVELAMGPTISTNPADEIMESAPAPETLMAKAAAPSMDLATAVALARDNRLVVRIQSVDVAQAEGRIAVIATRTSRPGEVTAWRVQGEAPAQLAMEFQPLPPPPLAVRRELPPSPFVIAGASRDAGTLMGPIDPRTSTLPPVPIERRPVYVVESRLDEASLQSLLGTLSSAGGAGGRAVFAEAGEQPLPAQPPSIRTLTALWWTQPPAYWTPWVSIPVVVERAAR